jgi:hypothetical protein
MKKKIPVAQSALREFFIYTAYFRNVAQNVPKTFRVNVQGDSYFVWERTTAVVASSVDSVVVNSAYFVPNIAVNIPAIGNDRPIFEDAQVNLGELVSPAGTALKMETPVTLAGRSTLVITLTSPYATTIPLIQIALIGYKVFHKAPKIAPAPLRVVLAKAPAGGGE